MSTNGDVIVITPVRLIGAASKAKEILDELDDEYTQSLALDDVLFIHEDRIRKYGGSPGLRDLGLLKSAVAMPQVGKTTFHS